MVRRTVASNSIQMLKHWQAAKKEIVADMLASCKPSNWVVKWASTPNALIVTKVAYVACTLDMMGLRAKIIKINVNLFANLPSKRTS